MHRVTSLALLARRLTTKTIRCALVSSNATASHLPNPCIAMAPDSNHIICYHPEKPHPYDQTRPIDRTDSSFARDDSVFNASVQEDFNNRYYKPELTKRDSRLETEKLSQMFNEHPALFKPTPKRDKIRRAPQFRDPAPDRSGL